MYKRCQVVCLPTNQKATNGLQPLSKVKGGLFVPYTGAWARRLQEHGAQAFHLYILSDDKIEVGDWVTAKFIFETKVLQCSNEIFKGNCKESPKVFKKIIASTDPNLNLPQPSLEFLKVYCEKQPEEVMVKYDLIGFFNSLGIENWEPYEIGRAHV